MIVDMWLQACAFDIVLPQHTHKVTTNEKTSKDGVVHVQVQYTVLEFLICFEVWDKLAQHIKNSITVHNVHTCI